MDLGSSSFTEFKMNEDVTSYMAENMELFEYDLGLIHSHHSMTTFFSGTDTSTLQSEGNERNCFVSLIVNNEGTYSAAITRKMQTKNEVTVKNLSKSYEFFGEGAVEKSEDQVSQTTQVIDKEVIEYFMLDVERETTNNHLEYLDARFDEIRKQKYAQNNNKIKSNEDFHSWIPKREKEQENRQLPIWDKEQPILLSGKLPKNIHSPETFTPDPELIYKMVYKLVTCNLDAYTDVDDLDSWIDRHMAYTYEELFKFAGTFDSWCDFAIDYLMASYNDPELPEEYYQDYDSFQATLAEAMIDELQRYPTNEYIESYIATLNLFLETDGDKR